MFRYTNPGVGYLDGRYVNIIGDTMTGPLIITPTADGTSIFRVNKADGTVVFNVDTTNRRVGIRRALPDSAFHIKADFPGVVGNNYAGQLIIQNPIESVFSNVVITAYDSDSDGNPDQQLWYLGSSSVGNSDITFLNRRNSKLVLGTNNTSRITILGNDNVNTDGFIRKVAADYRRYYHLDLASFDPGASGAVWTSAGADGPGGWQLDNANEILESKVDVHADWDGASDPVLEIRFQINTASVEDNTVDFTVVAYYMGNAETGTKTQTVTVATNVGDGGAKAQYTMFTVPIPLNWDETDNVIEVGDCIGFAINLATGTSEVDNVIVNAITYYYNTTHIGIESGDI